MICLAYVTAPVRSTPEAAPVAVSESQPAVTVAKVEEMPEAPPGVAGAKFTEVNKVIQERCSVCHSAQPSSPMFSAAPLGFMLDTPQQIKAQAAKIHAQTVASQIMPLGNITQMTQEERDLIGAWIAQGAPLD
jgi:uncharacterized membrane protein